jgi:hypothetical protein
MRRGLMAWSREEVPPAVLERRVACLAEGVRTRSLHCLLAYTDFTRPAAVSALTHFIPYWSNGVLMVTPTGGAKLVATLSRRVNNWVDATSRLDVVSNALDLGAGVAEALPQETGTLRIGVIDLPSLPQSVVLAVRRAHTQVMFEEAGDLLAQALDGDDAALGRRALAIAQWALEAGAAAAKGADGNAVVAAAELAARLAGAEEILIALAPDAAADPRLRRIEGATPLASVFALQATVAYKGTWIRLARTYGPDPTGERAQADAWFTQSLARASAGESPAALLQELPQRLPGAALDAWRLEAATRGLPLSVIDGSGAFADARGCGRAPVSLSLRLQLRRGAWFAAAPLLA